ncbi:MAG: response regulator, partial [Planctomycetota bacterium]
MRNVPDSAPLGLPSMTSTAQHTAPRAGTPVVLIDDNEELADNLREILEARGYACEIAHTGKRGQRLAERIHPDVCVIDLNLPDVHGLEILAQLREQLPETECVVLTGYGALETAIEAVNRGAFAYGVKSFRFDDVLTSIDRAATAVQQRREHASLAGELDRERSLLDATFEGGPLAMLALAGNGGGEVLRANARAKGLFGLGSHPTARVERTALLNLARNETERRRLEQALQCPPGSRRTADIDVNRPHAGPGTVRVFVQHTSPTTSRDDQVTVVMLEDITEARELARIAESSSRLAAVGELAARVAHEIRNPLQGIAGAVRVLSRGWEADPNRRELAGEVSAQIKRLNDFVEDLLVMARPLRVDPRRLEGRKAIEGALTVLREHPVVSPLEITVTAEDSTELWVD